MRDILFRGKRIDNGEWVEGIPITNKLGTFICYEKNPHYFSQYFYMEIQDIAPVIPESVGQFTGLTDKNDKKIFEGDIVRVTGLYPDRDGEKRIWRQSRVGEIFYYHSAFYFYKWLLCKTSEKCLEIIGNIHDNPELIEADV